LRRNKEIGSNLDARAVIHGDFKDKELLSAVVGTWDMEIKQGEEIKVEVKKSELQKCDRCWRHIEGIGPEGICPRCAKALAEI